MFTQAKAATGSRPSGESNDEIARALWISRYTVKDHAKAVYAKLGVPTGPS